MYEFNGWMSLYQMEVYVNEPCADLTCGANHTNTRAMDHDRNKSARFRRQLVFSNVTTNPHHKIYIQQEGETLENLGCFNFAGCDVEVVHFILADPGESKVTIWPALLILVLTCKWIRFQVGCNYKCIVTEWNKGKVCTYYIKKHLGKLLREFMLFYITICCTITKNDHVWTLGQIESCLNSV